eukprot:661688-Pelagomonas_calceolata.AAC.2
MNIESNPGQFKATINWAARSGQENECSVDPLVLSPFAQSSVLPLWLIGDPDAPSHCCYYSGFLPAATTAAALIAGLAYVGLAFTGRSFPCYAPTCSNKKIQTLAPIFCSSALHRMDTLNAVRGQLAQRLQNEEPSQLHIAQTELLYAACMAAFLVALATCVW